MLHSDSMDAGDGYVMKRKKHYSAGISASLCMTVTICSKCSYYFSTIAHLPYPCHHCVSETGSSSQHGTISDTEVVITT
jgi:hypothetical protein